MPGSTPRNGDEVVGVVDAPGWQPATWRAHDAAQQPGWTAAEAAPVLAELRAAPALVFAGEARTLVDRLAAASRGEAFLLQAGDCAESFDEFTAPEIREKLRVLLQMTVVLAYSAGVPVVKVGRLAGQYGKPRSSDTETREGVTLPSFRGHIVNGDAFDAESRRHDPARMLTAYYRSAATLNLVRAFSRGGFASLERVQGWNQDFVDASPQGEQFRHVADAITDALRFMQACGVDTHHPDVTEAEVFTSHEALVLDYEEALCRRDSLTGIWYDTSAHMLWVGERTRQLDGAHIEFCRGISNPLGVKLGPDATADETVALCEALNPLRVPGRLTLVTRMGAELVRTKLVPLVQAVTAAGHPVVWACDPMHGNTTGSAGGLKTRHFDDVLDELTGFFEVHRSLGTVPGGVHIELTGNDVTECLGGADAIGEGQLAERYETVCDPRLNARQSIELAFRAAELLRGARPAVEAPSGRWVRDDESGEVTWLPLGGPAR